MGKIRVGIAGFGNIGKGALSVIPQNPDMELSAIFTRRPEAVVSEVKSVPVIGMGNPSGFIAGDFLKTGVDVVILCGGSKEDLPVQGPLFAGISNTVDSFDTHAKIPAYFKVMDEKARRAGKVAVICAGWDPGLFSMMRTLFGAVLPESRAFTFWGPGVSQGHSDAVRKIPGVLDARQYTLPIEAALEKVRNGKKPEFTPRQMHTRLVYVVLKKGADKAKVRQSIIGMENYFKPYRTKVVFITAQEMARNHSSYPHGGFVLSSGKTGKDDKQILEFRCQLESNPRFTASILLACARAAFHLQWQGKNGAFTMLDIPLFYFSPYSPQALREKFV